MNLKHVITLIHTEGDMPPESAQCVADLQAAGFVGKDGKPTARGYDCLREIREHKLAGGLYSEFVWPED